MVKSYDDEMLSYSISLGVSFLILYNKILSLIYMKKTNKQRSNVFCVKTEKVKICCLCIIRIRPLLFPSATHCPGQEMPVSWADFNPVYIHGDKSPPGFMSSSAK